jgi:hypothetical protein
VVQIAIAISPRWFKIRNYGLVSQNAAIPAMEAGMIPRWHCIANQWATAGYTVKHVNIVRTRLLPVENLTIQSSLLSYKGMWRRSAIVQCAMRPSQLSDSYMAHDGR